MVLYGYLSYHHQRPYRTRFLCKYHLFTLSRFLICSRKYFLPRTSEHSNGLQRTTFSFGYHADAQESTSIPLHNQITKAKTISVAN